MASPQRVKLDELLSTCVDASLRGCAEIRRVQAQRVSGGAAALTIMEAKDEQELAGQYLTEADLAAQAAIVAALQNAWPGVHIIGEEDDSAPSLRHRLGAPLAAPTPASFRTPAPATARRVTRPRRLTAAPRRRARRAPPPCPRLCCKGERSLPDGLNNGSRP